MTDLAPPPAMVAAVEASMVDHCTIATPPESRHNGVTNEVTVVPGTTVYDGRCSLAEAGGTGADAFQLRGAELESRRFYILSIPRDAPAPQPGHHVEMVITADESLDGLSLVIRKTRFGTRMARRMVLCEMIQVVAS